MIELFANISDKLRQEASDVWQLASILSPERATRLLSEYTKAYLNSYMTASRPELSDFSKQFLNTEVTNNFTTRPELSNITRAYLFSQNSDNDEK